MHYGDDEQRKENRLSIVVYWHGSSLEHHESDQYSKLQDFEITSIQQCQYVEPHILKDFLTNYRFTLFDKITPKIEQEKFYAVTIKFTGYYSELFDVVDIKDVSDDPNEFYRLH